MTIIKARLNDQELSLSASPVVASGGVGEDNVKFVFDDAWTGYTKKAVFYCDESNVYHVDVGSDDTAVIPWEVLQYSGFMYFGVFGIKGDEKKTSTVVRYRVEPGAITSAAQLDPTPNIYAEIITKLNAIRPTVMFGAQIDTSNNHVQMDDQDAYDRIRTAYENGSTVTIELYYDSSRSDILPLVTVGANYLSFAATTGYYFSPGHDDIAVMSNIMVTLHSDYTSHCYKNIIYEK